jgi:hypothetical protein
VKAIKCTGVALIATLTMGAVGVATAAAEPEFKPEAGTFPITFSSKATKKTKLITKSGNTVECTSDESSGEVSGARLAKKVVVKFKGCKSTGFISATCTTSGASSGEIRTSSLNAKPVFINGKTGKNEERGLDLTPEATGPFAAFSCTIFGIGPTLTVENKTASENSVIGVIPAAEVGKQESKVTITFSQSSGNQIPSEYEEPAASKHLDFLETEGTGTDGFTHEASAEEGSEELTFSGNIELT